MKKFSEFLKEYQIGDNPTVRDPASKEFLNKHLVMKYKLSVPTEDENLFNAANISPGQAHRRPDNTTPDDHSIGYTRPVMFGDYLNYLLKMRSESVEYDTILSELEELDDEVIEEMADAELPLMSEEELNELADFINTFDIIVEEVEEIQELDRNGILKRYLAKTNTEYSSPKENKKRRAGRDLALKKRWHGAKVMAKEEVELSEADIHSSHKALHNTLTSSGYKLSKEHPDHYEYKSTRSVASSPEGVTSGVHTLTRHGFKSDGTDSRAGKKYVHKYKHSDGRSAVAITKTNGDSSYESKIKVSKHPSSMKEGVVFEGFEQVDEVLDSLAGKMVYAVKAELSKRKALKVTDDLVGRLSGKHSKEDVKKASRTWNNRMNGMGIVGQRLGTDLQGNKQKVIPPGGTKAANAEWKKEYDRKRAAQMKEEVELEEGDTHHFQGHATYIKRGGPSEKNPGTVSIAATKTVEHNVPYKASHAGSRPTNDKIMRSVKDHPRHKELEADGWKLHKWTPKAGFDTRKKIGEEVELDESSHKKSDYIGVKGSTLSLLGRKKPVEKKKVPLDAPWPAKGSNMSMHGRKKDGSFKEEAELQEGMPSSIIKHKQQTSQLSDKEFAAKHGSKSDEELRAMARRHGYGANSDYYVNRKNRGIKEETVLDEAKRGRPPKNKPAEEGEEQEHQPILVQLRKHEISRGQTKIKFNDGSEHHVEPKHVKKALDKHVHLRTSIEKGDYQAALAHSHASFKKAIGAHD